MTPTTSAETSKPVDPRVPLLFGIGIALFLLYLVTFAINVRAENDWYTEAWPSYELLIHGHVLSFLRDSPAYVGSLIMRAPFALLAGAFGASARTGYIFTALPCLLAPGLFAGYVAANRPQRSQGAPASRSRISIRPVDLFMATPSAIVCVSDGHPEDALGAVLCILAVLLAYRGSGRTAGFLLGVALINKSWAVVVVPFLFAVMPADRRLAGFITMVVTAGTVLIPVTAIRATSSGGAGNALGDQTGTIFLIPQLLWWFPRNSWIVREAHVLLVALDWLVAGVWWWLRVRRRRKPPSLDRVLLALALLFFLRAAVDPWDNIYYLAPFMLAVMTYEDPPGFPKLSWLYAILIVVIIPPQGLLKGLGFNAQAGVFAAFALLTIAYFGWRAFSPQGSESESGRVYAAASGSPT